MPPAGDVTMSTKILATAITIAFSMGGFFVAARFGNLAMRADGSLEMARPPLKWASKQKLWARSVGMRPDCRGMKDLLDSPFRATGGELAFQRHRCHGFTSGYLAGGD